MKKIFLILIAATHLLLANDEALIAFPDMPEKLTSLGAVIVENTLYIYGGHAGKPHRYSQEEQSNRLWQLKLDGNSSWQKISQGSTRLQGLAMVAHGGHLYRIGGFTAKNKKGEEHDLWSTDEFFRYSIAEDEWQKMPPLPESRSSHDAAVLNGKVYVVGGWKMAKGEKTWHTTAYVFDLTATQPAWKKIATPPFTRRALAVAAFADKIYVIGGMKETRKIATGVDIYDPQTDTWSVGPQINGEPVAGFGCSAFAQKGALYVSSVTGKLQRLNDATNSWDIVQDLPTKRFFHRMLPYTKDMLLMVGGSNMHGKVLQLDVLQLK